MWRVGGIWGGGGVKMSDGVSFGVRAKTSPPQNDWGSGGGDIYVSVSVSGGAVFS